MEIGLFFGSFNPVHIGHLIIASYFSQVEVLDEVWMVLSPQNPLKEKKSLADDYVRLEMLEKSLENQTRIKVSTIEFDLPIPSYTVDTLTYLQEENPENKYHLIMGADNLLQLKKWKNFELILRNHKIHVYNRIHNNLQDWQNHPSILFYNDAPIIEISSTQIRHMIKSGKPIQFWVTEETREIIEKSNLYL